MNKERARLDVANAANELIIVALRERITDLETCLIKIRELLAGQKDKSCLGTGYPSNENDCAPWPLVDEAVNNITQALKAARNQ